MNNKMMYTAVFEPASHGGFDARIEEVPEITTQGPKIAVIKKDLLAKLAAHQKVAAENIALRISVRVEINF